MEPGGSGKSKALKAATGPAGGAIGAHTHSAAAARRGVAAAPAAAGIGSGLSSEDEALALDVADQAR